MNKRGLGLKQPDSVRAQAAWTDFPWGSYCIHSEDYYSDEALTLKAVAQNYRSRATMIETVIRKSGNYKLLQQKSISTRIRLQNNIRIHYDNGLTTILNRLCNIYSTIMFDKLFNQTSLRLGCLYNGNKFSHDNRLSINLSNHKNNYNWTNKFQYIWNQFTFYSVLAYDIGQNALQKNNFMIKYKNQQTDVFLRAEVNSWRKVTPKNLKNIWDCFKLNYIRSLNPQTKLGLELNYGIKDNKIGGQIVVEKHIPQKNLTIKGKINDKCDVSLMGKKLIDGLDNRLTISLGGRITSAHVSSRSYMYGAQLDFNV